MDAKDFGLLVALDEDARQSFHALGRKVSRSAPAVRDRLRRLEERGIVHGYRVSINPAVFGRHDLLVSFGGEWSREEAMKALGAPDIAWVAWKVDGGVTLEVWPHDVKNSVAALERFLGRTPSWQGIGESAWKGELTRLDWRVLDVLIDDPRGPVDRLSTLTGLSPKTVRKHLNGMIRSETIYVVPLLRFLADSGEIVYHLAVSGNASFADLKPVIGDAVLIHETQEAPRMWLFCRADSLGELTSKIHALERLPGESSVRLSLSREMMMGTEFIHRLVRETLEKV